MNHLFAFIYEVILGIFNQDFWLIFQVLFDDGGYTKLGVTFLFVPLFLFSGFYFLWKYPYARVWHWLLYLLLVFIISSSISWGVSNNEIFLSNNQALNDALADSQSGFEYFANTLPIKYAFFNGLLSIFTGFIYSLILKQYSKIQIHLPF